MFWYIFERLTTSFGVPVMDGDMLLLSAASSQSKAQALQGPRPGIVSNMWVLNTDLLQPLCNNVVHQGRGCF
jgi:hypothetical protein